MQLQANLKLDLLALGLFALVVFLAASLASYDPADPPSSLVYPPRQTTANLCGRAGALAATLLLEGFGLGAYYLLVWLAALDAMLLARRQISYPLLRLAGWLLSLWGLTTLAALAVPWLSPGPVIGAGGYLGAAGRGLLEMHFASVGAVIVASSMLLGGLLLCTDYLMLRVLNWTVAKPLAGLGRGLLQVIGAYSHKLSAGELPPGQASQSETSGEAVKTSGDAAVRIVPPGSTAHSTEQPPAEQDAQRQTASRGRLRGGNGRPKVVAPRRPEQRTEQAMASDKSGPPLGQLDTPASTSEPADYELPSMELLEQGTAIAFEEHEKEVRRKALILEKTFADFGYHVRVVEIQTGPVIAQFEVELEAGLRLSKITALADDLAISLRVPSVRIVAPIPGKNTVGIEVPNNQRQLVRLREVMEEGAERAARMRIPLFLGKDVAGSPLVVDLSGLPHLLIAGRTGTGKSVCLNSIIVSIIMTRRPDEVRLLLIDPKMVELSPYRSLPHLMHPVVTDMRKAEAILAWAVEKMEERYQLLARAGVRHISVYNQLGEEELMERLQPTTDEERRQIPTHLPYVVIVADELADLMMTAAKEVEGHIIRLAQKSRAVGIHLVLATQKPTVDVITGLIKSNLPARICFQVASRTDSRVVLDEMGAERLLGNGDMLFLWPGTSTLIRGQGTYLSDDEINRVIASVATSQPQFVSELVQLQIEEPGSEAPQSSGRDDLYEEAVEIVLREGRGSVSLLQRALGIGYGRAARLIDYMAEDGIVGPYNGSQAREVLLSLEQWQQRKRIPARGHPATAQRQSGQPRATDPSTAIAQRLPVLAVPKSGSGVRAFEDMPPFENFADLAATSSPAATLRGRRLRCYLGDDDQAADDQRANDQPAVDKSTDDQPAEEDNTTGTTAASRPAISRKASIAGAASPAGNSQSAVSPAPEKSHGQDSPTDRSQADKDSAFVGQPIPDGQLQEDRHARGSPDPRDREESPRLPSTPECATSASSPAAAECGKD